MGRRQPERSDAERARLREELHRDVAARNRGYRARALALFPHVCASCGREFSGPRLKELTVHHKDHNHHNNPPDGSNWELLCLYCHDHEHDKVRTAKLMPRGGGTSAAPSGPGLADPFAGLDGLLAPDPKADDRR